MNTQEGQIIKVGMADWKIAEAPDTVKTSGLGSCIGAVLYDESRQLAVLAHVMLPDSKMAGNTGINRAKFADTAMEDIFLMFQKKGCRLGSLKAKIAGGAQMFSFSSGSEMMRIGPRNAEAVKEILSTRRIAITGEDTGGNKGRTIEFDPVTTKLSIRTVNQKEMMI